MDNEEVAEKFVKDTEDVIIIVEGKNDKKALETIGVSEGNIITISGRPLEKVSDETEKRCKSEGKELMILTDFDRKGKTLAAKLTRLLQARNIHPNQRLRRMFTRFKKHEVEGVKSETI